MQTTKSMYHKTKNLKQYHIQKKFTNEEKDGHSCCNI